MGLKDKARKLPVANHEKEVIQLNRRIDILSEQLRKEHRRVRIAESQLSEAESRLEFAKDFVKLPRLGEIGDHVVKHRKGGASAIIVMCDWHTEERVEARTINGLNEYNLQIAEKRIRKAFANAVELLETEQKLSKINEIVLAVIGDLITGYIHEELVEGNYLSPTEACLFVQEQLCWGIGYLLKNTTLPIRIPTCQGNHGRTTQKKRISTYYKNSFEWLLYQQTAKLYANEPRVKWMISSAYHNYVPMQGKVVRFHHGDALKYGGGVGGITIPAMKAVSSWDRTCRADLDVFGHFHQALFQKKFIACNCLIGFNAYALEIKADFSAPSQTLIVIDKNRPGWVSAREIYCD